MAPDRPTGHGRLDDAALADRIRATATAVAERTAAPARDLDEPTILASPDHHRSPARLVGVAAACLLVVALVAGAVVALRDRTGQVTTDGTPSGPGVGEPGAGGLPRLLPTWVPEGYSLTETKVTPGPPRRRRSCAATSGPRPRRATTPRSCAPMGPADRCAWRSSRVGGRPAGHRSPGHEHPRSTANGHQRGRRVDQREDGRRQLRP